MIEDKTLVCRECGAEFIFTASEQQFYADKGFQNEPGRCPTCRAQRRASNGARGGDRQMFDVICDGCGQPTQVPFQPRGDRPVYCRGCFESQRSNRY
ncbi:MAG: zinc-ribbon domain containing protein [Christensenellales bacterium]|jgi:CxxC-x17-CxxC domain-containing protein